MAAVAATSYYMRRPESMLEHLSETVSQNGDVTVYLTGDMLAAFQKTKKGTSALNSLLNSTTEDKFMDLIVDKLSEVEWEFVSLTESENTAVLKMDFKYGEVLTVDGTIDIVLEKVEEENVLKRLFTNPWKISMISDVDL